MTTPTKAQRLSKEWFAKITLLRRVELGGEMAKEMRRLEAANAELLDELRHIEGATMDITCDRRSIREAARAAIAKHGGAA